MFLAKGEADPNLYKTPPKELADHPISHGRTTVGMMTAESPRFPTQESSGNHGLERDLHKMQLQYEPTKGSYGGPENSYLIYGPTREQLYRLSHKYGQESFIYSAGGKHELIYSNGPNQGKFHKSLPLVRFSKQPPDDYYTHLPGRGYVTLHFGDELHDSPVKNTTPLSHLEPPRPEVMNKSEITQLIASHLKKALEQREPWAGSYEWHEGHTAHHHQSPGNGVILNPTEFRNLLPLAKAAYGEPETTGASHANNDQVALKGVSTYHKFAQPYGSVNPSQPSDLKYYPMQGTGPHVDKLVKDNGYQVYYMGGKHGKADLANRNYNTGHLAIWDPNAESGGSFGHQDYTDQWRKIHELAHATTLKPLNDIYGEGRRMGGLGKQRTAREAKRAVHWEWLAAHKQRELAQQIGVHIPDQDFHRELNTVMHDAVHRAVTGRFTEPSDEGFVPHPHKVPLEHALGMVDEHARAMGLQSDHDTLKKFAKDLSGVLQAALSRSR